MHSSTDALPFPKIEEAIKFRDERLLAMNTVGIRPLPKPPRFNNSNNRPFDDRTVFNHLNTGLIRYSNPHCILLGRTIVATLLRS